MSPKVLRCGVAVFSASLIVLLAACGPTVGKPALRQVPVAGSNRAFDNADPGVLVADGKTYLFGSTNNRMLPVRQITSYNDSLATSQDQWARTSRDAMPTRPAWIDSREWEIWAPSVVKMGTRYVVYFAGHNGAANVDEANDQCIGRAWSNTPMGPYAPEAAPVYCGLPAERGSNAFGRGALDPEVFRSPDGRWWMTMALSRTTDNIGSIALNSSGVPTGGRNAKPAILASQSLPFHDGTDNGTKVGGFLENPSMTYDAKTKSYLLFYSAGDWYSDRYVTGFARCNTPTGPCALDTRGPFLKGGNGRSGPGGLSVYKAASGELRVVYASWQAGRENQVGPVGQYKRQTHWAQLILSAGTDPATQTVSLR